ncbi:hypothetical protein ACP4OV_006798 [Aristida adscensionis]
MASGSNTTGDASRPLKTLGQEFVAHRLLDHTQVARRGPLPRPLDMEKYFKNDPKRQTDLCTSVVIESKLAEVSEDRRINNIEKAVGMDSNMFILRHDDPVNYFHLKFKVGKGRDEVQFFAELKGTGPPDTVLSCHEVNIDTASVLNCRHCFGGILHPLNEIFIGRLEGAPTYFTPPALK